MKRGRPSYRDSLLAAKAGNDFYAAMSDRPKLDYGDRIREPSAREQKARPKHTPFDAASESDILKEVLAYLRVHKKVAWVARFNAGVFQDGNRYIRANSQRGMSDILGMLHGGRMFCCEVKRKGAKLMPHQAEFLATIQANGGIAFVAFGMMDAENALRYA